MDARPGLQKRRQPFALVVAADEDDRMVAIGWVGVRRDRDPVRDHAIVARKEARRGLLGHRRDGDPGVDAIHQEAPEVKRGPHPREVAVGVPGSDDRALGIRERRHAQRRCHRLVHVHDIELLLGEHAFHAADRARREHDVRQRAVRGHDDRTADGDDPVGKIAVPAGARVEHPRQVPGRVVAHDDLHVVAAAPQRCALVLGVLDHPSPVRPGERHDDADLHAATAANARASRSAAISTLSSLTASESRTQPAPLGPKPSPGATATRSSVSRRSGVSPSGRRTHM